MRSERVLHVDPASDRVYLAKQGPDPDDDLRAIRSLMAEHRLGKAFVRIDDEREQRFAREGFRSEARVALPNGRSLVFAGAYADHARAVESRPLDVDRAFRAAQRAAMTSDARLRTAWVATEAGQGDAERLGDFYRQVFETYPFPIHDPAYVRDAMADTTVFVVVEDGGSIVAAASAEIDDAAGTCEMTDFATCGQVRGRGLATVLLHELERRVRSRCHTAYTIARATNASINVVFAKAGYVYGGRLINNTHIGGGIESMNVWYRSLA